MNIYWFSDNDGHEWYVMVATDELKAWELLANENDSDVETVQEQYDLEKVTTIDATSQGKIAWIIPLECTFSIKRKPE